MNEYTIVQSTGLPITVLAVSIIDAVKIADNANSVYSTYIVYQ